MWLKKCFKIEALSLFVFLAESLKENVYAAEQLCFIKLMSKRLEEV